MYVSYVVGKGSREHAGLGFSPTMLCILLVNFVLVLNYHAEPL